MWAAFFFLFCPRFENWVVYTSLITGAVRSPGVPCCCKGWAPTPHVSTLEEIASVYGQKGGHGVKKKHGLQHFANVIDIALVEQSQTPPLRE